jgi:hypothetical protein
MEGVARLLLAVATAWGFGAAAGIIRFSSWGRTAIWCFVPVVLICPLLIPSEHVGLRAAAACISGDLAFKMVDVFRHRRYDGPAVREYIRFLVPFPVFAVVYPDQRRRLARSDRPCPHALRILAGLAGLGVGMLLAEAKRGISPFRSYFPLDHAAMLVLFVLAIESLSQVLYGLERLAGYDVFPVVRRAFLSRSVPEFWRRFNGRVHDWLHRNVFLASGGRRYPARGVVLVVLVSGLFHEVMFDVATSKITGYQLAFFLIQAPPVLASRWLERLARRRGIAGRVVAHGLTLLFLSAASVLFFRGVSDIFPFIYASRSPLP